jgi:hypothetical protein
MEKKKILRRWSKDPEDRIKSHQEQWIGKKMSQSQMRNERTKLGPNQGTFSALK